MSREISPLRLGADTFFVSAFSPTCPIKGNVKRNISPSARCRHFFCLGIQPNLSYKRECQEKYLPFGSVPTLFFSRHSAQLVLKKECQEKYLPFGSVPTLFLSR